MITLTTENFDEQVLHGDKPVLVDAKINGERRAGQLTPGANARVGGR